MIDHSISETALDTLADRVFAGEATQEERAALDAWITAAPGREHQLRLWHAAWAATARVSVNVDSALHQIRSRVEQNIHRSNSRSFGRVTKKSRRYWPWAVGAAVAGALLFALLQPTQRVAQDRERTIATRNGQEATIRLSDGTVLTLASNTIVRTENFGASSRTVVVERGQAFFDVARASGAPFTVRSKTGVAQVLGTAFLVRYDSASGMHVAVADGKVRVVPILHPHTGAVLTTGGVSDVRDSLTHVGAIADGVPNAEWVQGELLLHDASVATVLQTLSRWYGYQFRYADPALSDRVVTIMVNVRSSSAALAKLEQLLDVSLTVVGDTVTLTPKSPMSRHGVPRLQPNVWIPTREVGR